MCVRACAGVCVQVCARVSVLALLESLSAISLADSSYNDCLFFIFLFFSPRRRDLAMGWVCAQQWVRGPGQAAEGHRQGRPPANR